MLWTSGAAAAIDSRRVDGRVDDEHVTVSVTEHVGGDRPEHSGCALDAAVPDHDQVCVESRRLGTHRLRRTLADLRRRRVRRCHGDLDRCDQLGSCLHGIVDEHVVSVGQHLHRRMFDRRHDVQRFTQCLGHRCSLLRCLQCGLASIDPYDNSTHRIPLSSSVTPSRCSLSDHDSEPRRARCP